MLDTETGLVKVYGTGRFGAKIVVVVYVDAEVRAPDGEPGQAVALAAAAPKCLHDLL